METKARLTPDDLWRMSGTDTRMELVNGEVVEMAPAGPRHGQVASLVGYYLLDHVKKHGGGAVMTGDVGFVLELNYDPERVRGADVAFISEARIPEGKLPDKFFRGAPDLAVEILSPSESSVETQQKVRDYLEAGAKVVWVLAPQSGTATVYRNDGTARLLKENDSLEGENVLPGLKVPLVQVFPA